GTSPELAPIGRGRTETVKLWAQSGCRFTISPCGWLRRCFLPNPGTLKTMPARPPPRSLAQRQKGERTMSRAAIPTIGRAVSALHSVTLVTLLLAVSPDAAHSAPPSPGPISIGEARSLPLGTVVTIDGSVTVPSGACASSAATLDQGFAIQDRTGGIFVSVDEDLGFAPRRQVRVTGQLADDGFGLLVLIGVTDIKPHGRGPKVRPLPVATGAV